MRLLIAVLAVIGSCSAAAVYSNDFETAVGSGLSIDSGSLGLVSTPAVCVTNGSAYCGKFLGRTSDAALDNQTVTLSLTGLAPHNNVNVTFNFFALQSWDGNVGGVGPDRFTFGVDGSALVDTTFSNVNGYNQSYPNSYLAGDFAAQTGATEKNKLGFDFYGNAVYTISVSFLHNSPNLTLTFQGSNLQGWTDEGWGIDNLSVNADVDTTPEVPEPATVGMLAAGAALIGLRRLRQRV